MRRLHTGLLVLLASSACVTSGPDDARPAETRPLRWVPGLGATAVIETASASAEDRLGPPPDDCQAGDPAAFELEADVAPSPGRETVIASSAHGVVVVSAAGRRLGTIPFDCGSSGDRVLALAVGDARIGTPVIVVVAVTGGHRESATRVELLGFRGDELARMFTGEIERRDEDAAVAGQLRLTDQGLVHRAPDGRITRWRADPWGRTFTRESAR